MARKRLSLLSKIFITILAIPVLVVILAFGSLLYNWYLAPENTWSSTLSPDGRFKAYFGVRGFMDSYNARFYIVVWSGAEQGRILCRSHEFPKAQLLWSPDSRRVALTSELYAHSDSTGVKVFAIDGRNSDQLYTQFRSNLPKKEIERLTWHWKDRNTIVLAAEYKRAGNSMAKQKVMVMKIIDTDPNRLVLRRTY